MQARRYVEAPATRPLPFGLLSAALVIPDSDDHLALGVQYESLMCGGAHRILDACVAEAESQAAWTTDDGKQLVTADAFNVYALHTCRALGGYSTAEADALARLANGLGRAVEEGFEESLATADDLTPPPGTPVHPVAGLALLEEYAAKNYGGVPVLHITRGTGTLLTQMGAVSRYGTRLETQQGVAVASGGGYGATVTIDGTANDAGSRWMRITGAVVVRTGQPQTHGTHLQRDDDSEMLNDTFTLATQPVVVTTECIDAAVLVQAPGNFYSTDGGTP